MLALSSISEKPPHGAISGRAESASLTLTVFFPHAVGIKKQSHSQLQPVQLMRRDATVEVIGYLLVYWEGWLLHLDEDLAVGSDEFLRIVVFVFSLSGLVFDVF
jgi:target of rapamycin complex 2 subunit MAPKAP1